MKLTSGHKFGILLVSSLVLLIMVLASPSVHGHFDANDWDHNQAHFDTPIADPNQTATTQASTSTAIVTADQQVVVVPNPTTVVPVKRSFWDSNFWNSVNIGVGITNHGVYGYPVYGYPVYGGCGYNYCGTYPSSMYYKSYYTHYPRPYSRGHHGGHNNNGGGHNNNGGGHKSNGGGHKSNTFNRTRSN